MSFHQFRSKNLQISRPQEVALPDLTVDIFDSVTISEYARYGVNGWIFIASASAGDITTATTDGIDTTEADLLIIGLAVDSGYNTTPTDSKGNTWTQAANTYVQGSLRVRMWYSTPSSVGTAHTATAGSGPVGSIFFAAFKGSLQSSPEDQINGAGASATTLQPGSITPTADNELIVTLLGINSTGVPISIDSSFLEADSEQDFVGGDHYGGSLAYLVQGPAAAINPTWTRTNSNGMAAMQVSFKNSEVTTTLSISVSDTVGIAESVSMLETSFVNVFDSVGVTEGITILETSFVNVFDSVGITESVQAAVTSLVTVSDSLTVSESITSLLSSSTSVSDTVTINEGLQFLVESFSSVSDLVTITEQAQVIRIYDISVNDNLTISEDVGVTLVLGVSTSEAVSITEDVQLSLTVGLSTFDTTTITEDIQRLVSVSISTNDLVSITEDVNATEASPAIGISVFDSVTMSEAVGVISILDVHVSDDISISDIVSTGGSSSVSVFDAVTGAESVVVGVTSLASVFESVSISESVGATLVFCASVSDALVVENMVPNGDFETGSGTTNANFLVHRWSLTNAGAATVVTIDNSTVYKGSQSIKIVVDAGNSNNGLAELSVFPVEAGVAHTLRLAAFSDTAGQLQIQLRSDSGDYLQSDGVTWNVSPSYFNLDTTTSWSIFTVGFTPAVGQTGARISDLKRTGLSSQAGRTFYVDSISVNADTEVDLSITSLQSVFDTVTVTENTGLDLSIGVNVFDGVTLGEATTSSTLLEYSISVYDSISIEDFVGYPDDLVYLSEQVDLIITSFASVFDTVATSESVIVSVEGLTTYSISVYDSISIEDFVGYPDDIVYIFEQVDVGITSLISVSDSLSVGEAVSLFSQTVSVSVYDNLSIAENVEVPQTVSISVVDSVAISEAVTSVLVNLIVSVSDSVSLAEAVSITPLFAISVWDTLVVVENIAAGGLLTASAYDDLGISDIPSIYSFIPISLFDSVGATESISTESIRFSPEPMKYRPVGTAGVGTGLKTGGTYS